LFGFSIYDTTIKNNEINNWLSGVYINPSSNILFDGNYIHGNTAGIGSDGINDITVQNNTFTENTEGWGASTVGLNVQGHNNNFVGNVQWGIHNYGGPNIIDATSNWWGHRTGPYDGSDDRATGGWYNPSGQGDPVSDFVKYDPYLTHKAGSPCFIATAAFGNTLEGKINVLKSFRDTFLLTSPAGKAFVDGYYKYSPPIADYIAERAWVRAVVRTLLLPLVGFISLFV
jgi:hypothetical protein